MYNDSENPELRKKQSKFRKGEYVQILNIPLHTFIRIVLKIRSNILDVQRLVNDVRRDRLSRIQLTHSFHILFLQPWKKKIKDIFDLQNSMENIRKASVSSQRKKKIQMTTCAETQTTTHR